MGGDSRLCVIFIIFVGLGTYTGPRVGSTSDSNGSPTGSQRVILGEDEATAYTKLLEPLLAQFRVVLGRLLTNIRSSVVCCNISGFKHNVKKQNPLLQYFWL